MKRVLGLATKGDLVVFAVATLGVGAMYGTWDVSSDTSDTVLIGTSEQSGQIVSLRDDRTLTLHGPLGDSTIEIKQGQVRFTSSPCSNKQCVHSGWLSHAGDFAACLPNRVTLMVAGRDAFDSINF